MPRLLIIDNNDSFTYNLVQIIEDAGCSGFDVRNCKDIVPDEIVCYDRILISPGPGVPSGFPLLKEVILRYHKEKSILGICLGHQAIAEAFGLKLYNMGHVHHGNRSKMHLSKEPGYLFHGVPSVFFAGLYHSWAVQDHDPAIFNVTVRNGEGIIMGLTHTRYDLHGLQFHPESYMTEYGALVIRNWLEYPSKTS